METAQKRPVTRMYDLLDMESPVSVYEEVKRTVRLIDEAFDFTSLDLALADTISLYHGEFPGYRGCTTDYHDLKHTTDVFLAAARLIHGAWLDGQRFDGRHILLALVASLLHDTGYIQEAHDTSGTGGKYTLTHVSRSIRFASAWLRQHRFSHDDVRIVETMIRCTSLVETISEIPFPSPQAALLGRIIGTADFIGQIADRVYLEKLLFLYREFREGNVVGYDSELDLLRKTVGFYEMMQKRIRCDLGGMPRFLPAHFRVRWGIDRDMYDDGFQNNLQYLNMIIGHHQSDYRKKLKRGGIVARLAQQEKGSPQP